MKKFSITLIICLLVIFVFSILYTRNSVKVLKVYSPDKVALDLNKNGKVEANEKFTVDGIETFSSHQSDLQKSYAKNMNLEEETALAIGYFAEKYAQNLLENKNVKFKQLNNKKIILSFNGKNYNKIIQNSPFALINKKPKDKKGFEKQIKLAKTYQLRIYNNKSNKYHRLNCKYGQLAHDSIYLPIKQLPKNAQACKYCENQITKNKTILDKNQQEKEIINKITSQKFEISQEQIKLFLTDLTTNFIPSRNCTTAHCLCLVEQINNAQQTIDMAL